MTDYNKVAEFIVQNAPDIVPEYVGEQLAETEADISTWLKGTERTEALKKRAAARNWLKETARKLGYTGELEPEELVLGEKMIEVPVRKEGDFYWEVTNMVSGEVLGDGTPYRTIAEAVSEAQYSMDTKHALFRDEHLVIKVFSKSPGERFGVTLEPEYTESYWIEGAPKRAREVLERISQPLTERLVPKTYGDWVDLGVSIKEKVGINDFETTTAVNDHLNNIYYSSPSAEESKRWLMQKAGELGIK